MASEQKTGFFSAAGSERWHSVLGKSTPSVKNVFKFESVLGKGSFGTTYLVTHKGTKEQYACKSIPKHKLATRHQLEAARLELEVQNRLSGHPNVVTLQGVYEDNMELHIILELCSGGTIYDVLVKTGVFSEHMASKLMHQVITAVAFCHASGIMHRDVKLENFLLSDPSPDAILKMADFGLSKFTPKDCILTSCCGTPQYMAPEVLDQRYAMKADVWSCGVILFIILSGSYPFSGSTNEAIRASIRAGLPDMNTYPWDKLSAAAKDCMCKMLNPDPNQRPSAEEMLKHPFLCGGNVEQKPLDAEIIIRLRKFAGVLRFKQEAARKLAEMLPRDKMENLRAAYLSLDTNSDGHVEVQELKFELQRRGVPPVELEDIAASLDVDRDGKIDLQEFLGAAVRFGKDMRDEHMQDVFKQFDTDGDGFIDREELESALKEMASDDENGDNLRYQVAATLAAADTNKDGLIDLSEFKLLLSQQESMSLMGPTTTRPPPPPSTRASFYDIYGFGKVLRSCMYGCVYEVTHKMNGTKFCCKTINKLGLPPGFDFRAEERVLRRLSGNVCVIALIEAKEGANHLHLLTEKCNGPDLFTMLTARKRLTEADAANAMAAVLTAVAHCHSRGVVHRDVRAETFLMSGPEADAGLKAAEFGLAVEWKPGNPFLKEVVGSLYYIAPEVLAQRYDYAADVWSAGVLMHVLLAGKYPFRGPTQQDTFNLISKGKLELINNPWPDVSEQAKDLLLQMLQKDPSKRITAAQALQHPWLSAAAAAISAPGVAPAPDPVKSRELPGMALAGLRAAQLIRRFISTIVDSVVSSQPATEVQRLTEEFSVIDKDKSGTISATELMDYLKKHGVELPEPLQWMREHDMDRDSEINLGEFVLALRQEAEGGRERLLLNAFQARCKDKGFMTTEDVTACLASTGASSGASTEEVMEVLKLVDKDGDGRIDFHDVMAVLRAKRTEGGDVQPVL